MVGIEGFYRGAVENLLRVVEVDAMVPYVLLVFLFVPIELELHLRLHGFWPHNYIYCTHNVRIYTAKNSQLRGSHSLVALVPFDVIRYRARFLDITVGESHDPLARGTSFSAEGKHDIDTPSMYRLWL